MIVHPNDLPCGSIAEMKDIMERHMEVPIKAWRIKQQLYSWRLSFKSGSVVQSRKFTWENLQQYVDFYFWINMVDLSKVKFLDEVRVVENTF
jgi:hypothetical protein